MTKSHMIIFAYLFKSFKSKNKILKISKISLILSKTNQAPTAITEISTSTPLGNPAT
jgi:hypothetical protein